jgi:hypothetical protein
VQAAAGALEKLIREKADSGELELARQRAAGMLDQLVGALRAALGSPVTESPAPAGGVVVDPAKAREAAGRLISLLAEFDPAAADFIEENRAVLRPLFTGENWAAFEALVQGYSFADAQSQLEQALKQSQQ